MARNQTIGGWGEKLAAAYLIEKGCSLIDTNVRTPYGEIDIIVLNEITLVFVEVKTRTSPNFGFPEGAITSRKRSHLSASAEYYLQEHSEIQNGWRIDVIAIRGKPGDPDPEIIWFENAVN
ncbi:MAG: YraN family protein [Anaerolineaceae bacterium]|nr:YraN family protein [Anaerolineaceae bacterium]